MFGGEITSVNRYGGSPTEQQVQPEWSNKIMHATFTSGGVSLMAADSSATPPGANNAKARLSVGWGASFGMLVDHFGIEWMVYAG